MAFMANRFYLLLFLFATSSKLFSQSVNVNLSLKSKGIPNQIRPSNPPREMEGWAIYSNTNFEPGFFWKKSELKSLAKAKYLIAHIYNYQPHILSVEWCFFNQKELLANSKPVLKAKINVLPLIETQIVLPLSALNNQSVFLPKLQRQLKGTIEGKAIKPDEVTFLSFRIWPNEYEGRTMGTHIAKVTLSDKIPASIPTKDLVKVVDSLGQWASNSWDGKTESEKELTQRLQKLANRGTFATYSEGFDEYGGDKNTLFEATGFFRTHFDGNRWWLVTPNGHPFLSSGINSIRPESPTPYNQNSELFEQLPNLKKQPKFKPAYSENLERGQKLIDFAKANLIRGLGENWENAWITGTTGQLKQWGFNTVGNWSSPKFIEGSKMPFVLPLKNFPTTKNKPFRDFPDVFSPEYAEAANNFALQLDPFKTNPLLIGYFLDNEPEWAFGDFNLAGEILSAAKPSDTKTRLLELIESKWVNLNKFNQAMGTNFTQWSELGSWKVDIANFNDEAKSLFKDLNTTLIDQYIGIVCRATKKVAPKHLNLGIRYAWISSDLCYTAGNYFDVFSVNGYSSPEPPKTDEILKKTGKPVLIGEFHFGALDRGLPATGLKGSLDQKERGKACKYYLESGFSRPEVVGIHYFQYLDQPITGRFDGENYQIGVVDICFKPYTELVESFKEFNRNMYSIARKQKAFIQPELKKTEPLY